ncbi:hypothetical protein [Curtobacterium flaccumfaciens]|uniref:hypothetical protein n=1 Tax=Curtobacterium flaccumfaciens TaxID=2035 RepID=UPI003EBA0538
MPDIEDLGTAELRRSFPALSSLLPAIFYPTWEMDYRGASEAFNDALEGFSVQSATDVRAEIDSVLSTDIDDAAVSAFVLKLNASVDPMTHTGLGGRAFLKEFANAVVTHVFRPSA